MNNNFADESKNNIEKKPSAVAVVLAAVFTMLLSCVAVYFVPRYEVVGALLAGAAASVCLSFVMRFFKSPISVVLPFAGLAIMQGETVYSLICTGSIALCGALFALMLIRRWDSFSFFLGGSLAYSVVIGSAAVALLIRTCGSFSAGLEKIMELIPAYVNELLEGYGEEMVSLFTAEVEMYVAILPSVVITMGIMLMWLTNRLIGGFYAILGGAEATRRVRKGAPKALAVIFLLVAIFGGLMASGDMGTYYAVLNLKTVLTAVFFGEGVRAFVQKILFMRGTFFKVILAVAVVNLFVFLSPVAIMALSYYGVYKTLYRRTVITIIRKDQ